MIRMDRRGASDSFFKIACVVVSEIVDRTLLNWI